ncbi:MAG: tripartite tricarboxylate transporter substrate binding protein [Gammaproteobacteria bacterium]|nr:tripartite tricarboxylate transporter substrate binding protein [Gammaproteobacteria bacterium]
MKLMKITKIALLALTSLMFMHAQADYPDKPIGVMVAYGPGGATDFQARIATLASGKEALIGQPIYILNKPGAGGRTGWNWFASEASKDGYMLAAYNVPHFIAQSIVFDTAYNINTLEPLGNWGADPAVLIVGKDSPFNTVADLLAHADANPGAVTISGAGKFVGHHIAFLQFAKASGKDLTYIPAKGGVDALRLVKAGEVSAGFNNLSDSARSAADLKILAVADLTRHAYLPDVPTLMESGVDVDDSSVNFRGLMVPAGTPQDVIDFLASKTPDMFNDKKTQGKMKSTNSPARVMTRDEVIAMWNERQAYLTDLLAGLQ